MKTYHINAIVLMQVLVQIIQSQLDFILDTANPLKFTSNFLYYKQLNNGSIIIHFQNSTFNMYQQNFKYVSSFTVDNKVFSYIKLSQSQTVLKLIDSTTNFTYFYNIDTNKMIFYDDLTKSVLFLEYYNLNSSGQYFVIVNTTKIAVYLKNSTNFTTLINTFDLEVYKKVGDYFLQCVEYPQGSTLNLTFHCAGVNKYLLKIIFTFSTGNFTPIQLLTLGKKPVLYIYRKPFLLCQTDDKHLTFYDDDRSLAVANDNKLEAEFILQFIEAEGSYYIVTATKMLKAVYTLANSSIDLSKTVKSGLTFTAGVPMYLNYNSAKSMFDTGYQVGTNKLYSFDPCYNSTTYSSGLCQTAVCSMYYCDMCNIGTNVCTTCSTNFTNYLYKCVPSQCNVLNCTQCFNSSFCLTCNVNYTLQSNGSCLQDCFVDNCADCLNPYFCYTCSQNYTLNNLTGLCVQICNVSNCIDCYNPIYCNICSINYTLNISTGQCIQICNVSNCFDCLNPIFCDICNTNYSLDSNTGVCNKICNVLSCLDCLYPDTCNVCESNYSVSLNGSCSQICNVSNCLDCVNPIFCNVCRTDYALQSNGECILICDVSNCLQCQTRNFCATCNQNFTALFNGSCELICRVQNCLECLNITFCSICEDDYTLSNKTGTCVKQIILFSSEYLELQYNNLTQQIKSIGTVTKGANSIPALRITLMFLSSIFAFFDDYWYYIYHDNDYQSLNISLNFLNFMYQMNKDRIFPDFIEMDKFVSVLNFTDNKNVLRYSDYTNLRVLLIDQQPTYFLKNSKQLLISQYLFISGFMIILYLIYKIYSKLISHKTQKQSKLSYKIFLYLQNKASLRFFTILLLQSNLIFISFRTGTQLINHFSFSFQNKLNILATHIILLISILFSLCFYMIVKKKRQTKFFKREIQFNKAEYKTIFIGLKYMVFGLIHSLFLKHNSIQIICLIGAKVILIIFIGVKNKLFPYNSIKSYTLSYYVCGILLDIVFLLVKMRKLSQIISHSMITIVEAGLVSVIIGSVVACVITQIIYELRQFCKQNQRSKVYDDTFLQQQQQKKTIIERNIEKTLTKKKVNFKVQFIKKQELYEQKKSKFKVQLVSSKNKKQKNSNNSVISSQLLKENTNKSNNKRVSLTARQQQKQKSVILHKNIFKRNKGKINEEQKFNQTDSTNFLQKDFAKYVKEQFFEQENNIMSKGKGYKYLTNRIKFKHINQNSHELIPQLSVKLGNNQRKSFEQYNFDDQHSNNKQNIELPQTSPPKTLASPPSNPSKQALKLKNMYSLKAHRKKFKQNKKQPSNQSTYFTYKQKQKQEFNKINSNQISSIYSIE